MNLKRIALNLLTVAVSGGIAVLLAEAGSRLALRPSDYLAVEMVEDGILGAIPAPESRSAGFDAWGFRNTSVPQSVDVLAVGDSHTFGNTATMSDSWPAVLAKNTGRTVYNMGMGGYGPNQYLHVLKTQGLKLNPRVVICALYMGDDFENAYSITYGLPYWSRLRKLEDAKADADIWDAGSSGRQTWFKRMRVWLSGHSMTYQLVFHGPLMGGVQGERQIHNASELYPGVAASLILPEQKILEAFRPASMLSRLDQSSPSVREGMRITFEILKEMDALSKERSIQFLVAVIPTKESVFSQELEHSPGLALGATFDGVLANERLARQVTFDTLKSLNIAYIDTLPALQQARGRELYARTAADMHPGKNGYAVIAGAIEQALRR